MNRNFSSTIGRVAALLIAVETIVFAISLIWEVIVPSEFAKYLGYFTSLLIAPTRAIKDIWITCISVINYLRSSLHQQLLSSIYHCCVQST